MERDKMRWGLAEFCVPNILQKFIQTNDILKLANKDPVYLGSRNEKLTDERIEEKFKQYPVDVLFVGTSIEHDNTNVNPYYYGDIPSSLATYTHQAEDLDKNHLSYLYAGIKKKKKIVAFGRSALLGCIASGSPLVQKVVNHQRMMPSAWNVSDPFHSHELYFLDGTMTIAPSNHKSMMFPFLMYGTDNNPNLLTFEERERNSYEVLAYSLSTSRNHSDKVEEDVYECGRKANRILPPTEAGFFDNGNNRLFEDKLRIEPEIVLFRNTNMLCIQPNLSALQIDSNRHDPEFDDATKIISSTIKLFLEDRL